MDKFIPDIYAQSIYRINYDKLKKNGIKLVVFDLDNTIAPVDVKVSSKETFDLMLKIKEIGLKPIIMSNSKKERVEPFRNHLEIDSCYFSLKPLKKNYKKIMRVYNLKNEEIACVGDQILTDILGANKMGMTSILVNPISKKDGKFTIINRKIEKIIMNNLEKKDVFKKGKYYD